MDPVYLFSVRPTTPPLMTIDPGEEVALGFSDRDPFHAPPHEAQDRDGHELERVLLPMCYPTE